MSAESTALLKSTHGHDKVNSPTELYGSTRTDDVEAVADDKESLSKEVQETPSTSDQILSLAVPALGALLIDPLMTLADTAFVGQFSSSPEALAGMGSAAALLTFSFYLFNFFCTATTPLVASRRAAGLESEAMQVGGQALSFALSLGAVLTAFLLAFQQPLLNIMGTGVTGPEANEYALHFLQVRALAAPAVFCISASTGILRGYLDTQTPIYILVVANVLNFILDLILIPGAGLGPMGAAIATTVAEWTSAILFLCVLAGQLPSAGSLGNAKNPTDDEVALLSDVSIQPSLAIPAWEDVKPLLVASSSVFLRSLVLQVSLSAAAAMAARDGDASSSSIAAHQIAIQLWLLCSFICDALAAASQALVADALGREGKALAREISKIVFAYAMALGILLALGLQIGTTTHLLIDLFTKDAPTQLALTSIIGLITFSQPLNAFVFAADGVLQGASEFPFQAKAMALSGVTAVGSFLVLHEGINPGGSTLVHVWSALLILQAMRGLTSLWKLVEAEGPIALLSTEETK